MDIIQDLQRLSRMGASAAAAKDSIIRSSIASSANDSIFQFPCIVSDTVSLDMAHAVVKVLDRNYASFVQIVLSQVADVDITKTRTPLQFLKQIHQNMRLESVDTDKFFKENNLYDGNVVVALNHKTHTAITFENVSNGTRFKNLKKLNYDRSREYLSDYDIRPFMEADVDDDFDPYDVLNAAAASAATKAKNKAALDNATRMKNAYDKHTAPKLTMLDVKKMNDIIPYAIEVRLNVINDNHDLVEFWDIVVGIKTILHLVQSSEITDNILRSLQNKGVLFNMIRWTTGEISLFKDLLFHIDEVKFDIKNMEKGYTSFFPTLKRLKDQKVTFRNFKPTNIVPNASLIISTSELDDIEKKFGMSLKDVKIARRLMKNLFLMTLVIVDDATQTLQILYDGDGKNGTGYQVYALETIEREISLNSNKLGREIGRMIAK